MAHQLSVRPLIHRRRPARQLCECCRKCRRCRAVHVQGVRFTVCSECAELTPFDVSGSAA